MSIYDNPEEYAKTTNVTLEQAKTRCQYYLKIQEEIHAARKCPACGEHTLQYEGGSYEEGISEYVYCENDKIQTVDDEGDEYMNECEFTSEVTKEFEPIQSWYDFDVVLMFSIEMEEHGLNYVENQVGSSWSKFVDKDTEELINPKTKTVEELMKEWRSDE